MEWVEVERRIRAGEFNAFGLVLTEQQIIPAAHPDDIDFGAVRSFMQAQGLDVIDHTGRPLHRPAGGD